MMHRLRLAALSLLTGLVYAVVSKVPVPLDSKAVRITAPASVQTGQAFTAVAVFQNTGTATWTTAAGFKLGDPKDQQAIWGRDRWPLPGSVAPNAHVTVSVPMKAPAAAGSYPAEFQVVQENVAWLGQRVKTTVQVVAAPVPPTTELKLPPARADANDLCSAEIWNTGPIPADDVDRVSEKVWKGPPIKIVAAEAWTGVTMRINGDFASETDRIRLDGTKEPLIHSQGDRYQAPSGAPACTIWRVFPTYMTLQTGERIRLKTHQTQLGEAQTDPSAKAHFAVRIWFKY